MKSLVRSLEQALKRWLHPLVFATWTGFIIYLLATQRYIAFLRPEFGLLLALAHFIAMGFMIASLIRPSTTQIDIPAVLRGLILLVPVIYCITMPDTMLGNQTFKKRFIGVTNGGIGPQTPSKLFSPESENGGGVASPPEEKAGTRQEKPHALTSLDIFLRPDYFKGRRVIVTGMILRDEKLKPHFGGRDTAVYRFRITCCAADAMPLVIALDLDQSDAFANDQWVQVEGVFDLQQINDKSIPIILKPLVTKIEAPAVPYIF